MKIRLFLQDFVHVYLPVRHCGHLHGYTNANLNSSSDTYSTTVLLKCVYGYGFLPNYTSTMSTTCSSNKSWIPTPAYCFRKIYRIKSGVPESLYCVTNCLCINTFFIVDCCGNYYCPCYSVSVHFYTISVWYSQMYITYCILFSSEYFCYNLNYYSFTLLPITYIILKLIFNCSWLIFNLKCF